MHSRFKLASVALMLAPSLLACSGADEDTQVTVAITSETEIPKELNQMQVTVNSADGSEVSRVLHDVQNPRFFPATLAVIPRNDESLEGPITVTVSGQLNGFEAVFRRGVVSYAEGRTLLLPMPMRMACFNFDARKNGGCGADETCAGGTCQPAAIDASVLADFDESLVFASAAPNSCFDEEVCLGESVRVAVDANCEFEIPPGALETVGARPQLNVSIRWAAADNRVIGLDSSDPVEGWTVVSPTRGRLSEGVCTSMKEEGVEAGERLVPDKALDAWISTACPAKQSLQPFCRNALTEHVAIGTEVTVP